MVRLRLAGGIDLRLQLCNFPVKAGDFRGAFGFDFGAIGPVREAEQLDLAPAVEEQVVLGENETQDFAGLFGDGSGGIGQIPAFGEIFGTDVSSRFTIDGYGVISGG